jgi:enoyl-CoA hydratase/carnithine racemase
MAVHEPVLQGECATEAIEGTLVSGAVWHIVLRRPSKRNALTLPMFAALAESLAIADAHTAVRAIAITGEGPVFCAGHDLKALAQWPQHEGDPVPRFLHALAEIRKPLVIGVHGAGAGIGVTMLMHADWVIAAPDTQLALPFVNLGIAPEAASTLLLARHVGALRARRLLLGGEAFSSEDAERWGLVTELVSLDVLQARVLDRAAALGAKDSVAFQRIKTMLAEADAVHRRIDDEVDAINQALQARKSVSCAAGVAA